MAAWYADTVSCAFGSWQVANQLQYLKEQNMSFRVKNYHYLLKFLDGVDYNGTFKSDYSLSGDEGFTFSISIPDDSEIEIFFVQLDLDNSTANLLPGIVNTTVTIIDSGMSL